MIKDGIVIKVTKDAPDSTMEAKEAARWRRADVILNGEVVATGWARCSVGAGRDSTMEDTWRSVEGEAVTRAKVALCERLEVQSS